MLDRTKITITTPQEIADRILLKEATSMRAALAGRAHVKHGLDSKSLHCACCESLILREDQPLPKVLISDEADRRHAQSSLEARRAAKARRRAPTSKVASQRFNGGHDE
jgi:hypothetical protein